MNNIKKIPYEISLWEDVRKYEVYREIKENGTTTHQFVIVDKPEEGDTVVSSFYDEQQIAIIGSNTMSSPARAVEPYFTQRVNGEIILNFSIYYRYYDEEIGKIVNNPFTNLLCNERKVKVKLQRNKYLEPEWYDFVIKDIQEDSESGTFTYTATGLFVNELSKNGFELVFDAELESGQGTVESLGRAALEGSDWQFDKADIMVEKNIEVLYAITLKKDIECIKTIDKTSITIPAEKTIYVFYNVLAQKSDFFQFMYFGDKPSDEVSNELLDGDGVVIDEENEYSYHIENYTGWIDNSEDELNINIPDIAKETKLEPSTIIPRGKRIVRRGLTILDPRIDEYVTIYENNEGKRIYRYSTVKYPTSSIVQNLLVNGTNFSSSAGWESDSASNYVLPTVGEQISTEQFGLSQCYLDFHFNEENGKILNTGIYDNRFQIDEFKAGEEYVLKWERLEHSYDSDINDSFKVVLTGYKVNSSTKKYEFISDEELIDECELKETSGQKVVKIKKNLSTNVINSRVGIFFIKKKPTTTTDSEGKDIFDPVKFKEIQFFKKELDADGNIIIPGEPVESKVVTEYRYYDPAKNEDATSIEELVGVTIEPPYGYALAYDEDFNKNRAISVTESNRFNIIQTICETFECWADFKIGHEVNGKVSYIQDWEEAKGEQLSVGDCYFDSKKISKPKFVTAINKEDNAESGFLKTTFYRRINKKDKKVGFRQYIGKDNHVGFKYGINLNSIQRNINSDQIVTKIIVKDNSNEYAKNGACSISRADDSPTKENFLFNFDYYIKQGLLSYSEITNDLYLNASQYLNYYNRLRKLNAENQSIIETQAEIRKAILVAESNLTVYQTSREEALKDYNEELADLKEYLGLSATASNEEVIRVAKERIDVDKANNETYSDLSAESRLMKVNMLKTKYDNYLKLEQNTRLELGIDEEGNITENPGELEGLKHKELNLSKQFDRNLAEKALLNKKFYEKYSRFIQEGSWISDEYMDDNLYYFDAEGVLYTSSRPQISYTINVLDLSPLEGYEAYSYQIGDKTYIEDTEFFGWKIIDYRKVPAKEEVIVSEYVMYFDNPEQNVITVQNYKTQFEDLYQRITATTNSLQFHSGEYGRAASVVQSDGTIESGALQNSLLTTSYILENAKNQSVIWDDTGITTTNLGNANEIVRITSGAIAISNNGGETWSSAITGYGINANYIAAGSIDVSKVRIMNGNFPSFRWTSTGLDAYSFSQSEYGNYINTNFNKFVRFDQHGIYGMQGVDQDWIPNKLSDIINNDNLRFALTWDGLRINNDDGSVQIDDKDDITVTDKNKVQRIKIGRFNKTLNRNKEVVNSDYGIRLRNSNNDITLEAIDDGNLWLKDMLYIGNQTDDIGVRVGYNKDKYRIENDSEYHEVIYVGDESSFNFIVYEDGHLKATGANIEGDIYATGGKIGKIDITKNGLEIKEGTFAIYNVYNGKEEKVFYVDDDGNLQLKKIHASDGYFEGTIVANDLTVIEGSIGGFNIINKKEEEVVKESYLQSSNGNIKLDGLNGLIEAEQIHLGTGAKIMNYIELEGQIIDEEKLPSAFIYNPATNDGKFIEAGALKIDNKGTIESGTIKIDGVNSKIYIGKFSNPGNPEKDSIIFDGSNKTLSSNSWTIAPDKAIFNNITARGSIQAATFEYGKVQTVGGILFVKASSTVKNIMGDVVTVECNENNLFDINDLCCFSESLGMTKLDSSNIYKISEFSNGNKIKLKLVSINDEQINLEIIDKDLIGSPLFKLANTNEYILVNNPKLENILNYYEKDSDTGKFFQTKDKILVEGKQYYIINENKYISVNDPKTEDILNYYEKDTKTGKFFQTKNKVLDKEKDYYTINKIEYILVDQPKLEDISNYYEKDLETEEYFKTKDEELIEGKQYYAIDTIEYILVNNPNPEDILSYYEKDPETGDYFQIKDKILIKGNQYYIINTTNYFSDNFSIGINSTSNDSFLSSQSISFNELIPEENSYKNKIRMLLGDLKNIGYEDYGLYADNVILNGKLVSRNKNKLTAGINSKGQGVMPSSDNKNYPWHPNNKGNDNYTPPGNIILWGGSEGIIDAADAKFKVDENGNLYASSGYFEGAIITKSTIEAAEIRTATITGIGKESNEKYGLVLKDLKNGIHFKGTDENNNEITYFNLSDSSFETKDLNINFSFSSNETKLNIYKGGLKFNNTAQIGDIQISSSLIGLGSEDSSFNFINNNKFSIYKDIIKYSQGEGLKTSQTFSFSNKLYFNTSSDKTYMESYNIIENDKSVTKGYDLYITE